ncbi:AEC family transporter [Roseomonas sp. OT10]|uniref:AEC family transporter n=1 Tax=Roseomonas cutis TaxID=2897332 RepID=UPI001E443936|nr:AEC family transporter [Roseomonas sp. OT10]UFN47648.1 AEC family transporter [Roseomonas sp. OT10]
MLSVFQIILPVFAIILLGYGARRTGRISPDGVRGINDFVFLLALPALLFEGAATNVSSAATLGVAVAYFAAILPAYAVALLLARRLRRLRLADAGLFALDATYSNLAMVGIPIILAAYGPDGLRSLLTILAFHSLIMLPVATLVAEMGVTERVRPWPILRSTTLAMVTNPIILAVVAGTIWAQLLPPPPEFLTRLLHMLGAAGPPAALFCLGASLTGFDVRRDWPDALLGTVLKLLALPVAVWLSARFFGLDALGTAVAVTAAGMPTGANAFILARRYATGMGRSGATMLLASGLSVLTVSGLLLIFQR